MKQSKYVNVWDNLFYVMVVLLVELFFFVYIEDLFLLVCSIVIFSGMLLYFVHKNEIVIFAEEQILCTVLIILLGIFTFAISNQNHVNVAAVIINSAIIMYGFIKNSFRTAKKITLINQVKPSYIDNQGYSYLDDVTDYNNPHTSKNSPRKRTDYRKQTY